MKAEPPSTGLPILLAQKENEKDESLKIQKKSRKRKAYTIDETTRRKLRLFMDAFRPLDNTSMVRLVKAESYRAATMMTHDVQEFQSANELYAAIKTWSNSHRGMAPDASTFAGQYSIVASPNISHGKRVALIHTDLRKMKVIVKGSQVKEQKTGFSASRTLYCACGAISESSQIIKQLPIDTTKSETAVLYDSKRLSQAISPCGGTVRITVNEDDGHILTNIMGEKIRVEFSH